MTEAPAPERFSPTVFAVYKDGVLQFLSFAPFNAQAYADEIGGVVKGHPLEEPISAAR